MNTTERSRLPERLEIPGLYPPRRRGIPKWPVWLWLVVAAVAAIPLVGVPAVALAHYTTSNPEFCLTCHATGETPDRSIPSIVHPSFNEVGCVDCHAKPGQVVFEGYVNGFQAEPERVASNCVRCHAEMQNRTEQTGFKYNTRSIIINHEAHLERGATCVSCHTNVAHDTEEVKTNRPRMEYCYACHPRTESCAKCHGGAIPQAGASRETVGRRPVVPPPSPKPVGTEAPRPASAISTPVNEARIPASDTPVPEKVTPVPVKDTQPPVKDTTRPLVEATQPTAAQSAPAASLEEGKNLFAKTCAACHGPTGGSFPGANLSSRAFLDGVGTAALASATSQGKGGMPAFGVSKGGPLTDQQIEAIVNFLLSTAN